jgi:hypothetical protein
MLLFPPPGLAVAVASVAFAVLASGVGVHAVRVPWLLATCFTTSPYLAVPAGVGGCVGRSTR